MSQTHAAPRLPKAILEKLRLVRKRMLAMHTATALAAAIAVLAAAMGVAMLIDWLATLYDSPWRLALTYSAFGAAALTAAGWAFVARRSLGWDRLAADVDREAPQLQERWSTITQIGQAGAQPQRVHPAMFRRVTSEAARMAPSVRPAEVVDLSPLIAWLLALSMITVVLGLAAVLDTQQTSILFRRFWQPRTPISATELVDVTGDTVVGRGESFAVEASLQGKAVERATLHLQHERATTDATEISNESISLLARGDSPIKFVYHMETVKEPFKFRLRAGDGQTQWRGVSVADRPEIEAVQLVITPHTYTGQPAKSFHEFPRQIATLKGSRVELRVRSAVALKQAELLLGDDKSTPMISRDDGWYAWQATLDEGVTFSPKLTEPHGLTNRRAPKTEISVYADQPPTVTVRIPDAAIAVQPDDTLQITFSANDDVGIESAELLVYEESAPGEPANSVAAIPIELGEQKGATSIERMVELDLSKLAARNGTNLSYEIRVREHRGSEPLAPAAGAPPAPSMPSDVAVSSAPSTPSENKPSSVVATGPGANDLAKAPAESTKGNAKTASAAASKDNSRSTTAPASDAGKAMAESTAKNATLGPASSPHSPTASSSPSSSKTVPGDDEAAGARTASTGRQGMMPEESPENVAAKGPTSAGASESNASSSSPAGAASASFPTGSPPAPGAPIAEPKPTEATGEGSPQNAAAAKSQPPGSVSGQMASSGLPAEPNNGTPPPGDSMSRRTLDVPQTASSQRMSLTVDEWAGSFAGQQQEKVAIAVDADLEALETALKKAEAIASSVLKGIDARRRWSGVQERDLTSAEQTTVGAQEVISNLQAHCQGTPYAFVGLQVVDIGLAHVDPARSELWKTLQTQDADRRDALSNASQHLSRAIALVAELRGQFKRARREFQLAAMVERVKKMHQVFIENSQSLLQTQDNDPSRYNRKIMEFDLDEEYLKRLKEVMEMRRDLRAELARLLAEDPRLLRRFMDSMRNRSINLREELADLVARQQDLNREVLAWSQVEESERPRMANVLKLRQLVDVDQTVDATGELQSRYTTWLSLDRAAEDPQLAATTQMVQEIAAEANDLKRAAAEYLAAAQSPQAPPSEAAPPADAGSTEEVANVPPPDAPLELQLDQVLADGDRLYERLTRFEVALRQLAAEVEEPNTAAFAANRLVETRRLIAGMSAWLRQMRAHAAGSYTGAAGVDQYRLALKTDELAGKLGSIEQTLAATMQREDGSLPAPIAEKARQFLATLDQQASPNQLAAVYALRTPDIARTTLKQRQAGEALVRAEAQFDDLMRMAIAELDKLPVQDPISDLLDDPTLDELLAQLEQELPLGELLGIPERPSNLQVVDDWLKPGGTPGGGSGGGQMAMNQMQRNDQAMRQKLDKAYERAVARALKEAKNTKSIEIPKSAVLSDWNQLASKLGDELQQGRDKTPSEQYRRAIEQYFAHISRLAAEKDDTDQ